MAGMFLTKLPVVIPANTEYSRSNIILLSLILSHYYWMIVAAWNIYDMWFS